MNSAAIAAVTAAFLASLVEVTEAYTIVLAVGLSRGWRAALLGLGAGLLSLAAIVLALGPVLDRVPLRAIELPIGILVLVFGAGWLRKAILRAAGVIALHDEEKAFAKEMSVLGREPRARGGLDATGVLTAYQGVLLEGLEVVFIVIAVGAGRGLLAPASLGAAAACLLILVVGAAVHRPLSRVPENTLKLLVGIMLTSFGIFWIGEALDVPWPGGDVALIYIATTFLLMALALARLLGARRELAA